MKMQINEEYDSFLTCWWSGQISHVVMVKKLKNDPEFKEYYERAMVACYLKQRTGEDKNE